MRSLEKFLSNFTPPKPSLPFSSDNNSIGITNLKWFHVNHLTSLSLGGPRLILTGDVNGLIRIWDGAGGQEIAVSKEDEKNQIQKMELPEKCISELRGHDAWILDFKLFETTIYSASEDGTCKVFDLSVAQ